MPRPAPGMRDLEVLESEITAIMPEGLFLRGIPLQELLEGVTFEEVAFLLWHGRSPTVAELQSLRRALARAWLLPPRVVEIVGQLGAVDPLTALQVGLPLLSAEDPEAGEAERSAVRILAQVPALLALQRLADQPAPLDVTRSFAPQVLEALGAGPLPDGDAERALILYADHELAASTFAARIAAAARSSLYDGISAAVAVLKGPLHGGSTLEAARMLRQLSEQPDVEQAVADLVGSQRRIPGFGHTIYENRDPRSVHFRAQSERLSDRRAQGWIAVAELLEHLLRPRGLHSNVDLYAAIWMHAAGLDDALMPGLFAVGRSAGWTAHMLEQQHNNRLIRPRARYTGALGRRWPS